MEIESLTVSMEFKIAKIPYLRSIAILTTTRDQTLFGAKAFLPTRTIIVVYLT